MKLFWQFAAWLLLVGFVLKYWWLIGFVVALFFCVKAAPGLWGQYQSESAERERAIEEIAARADQQHAWVMQGDPRGTYGSAGMFARYKYECSLHPAPTPRIYSDDLDESPPTPRHLK